MSCRADDVSLQTYGIDVYLQSDDSSIGEGYTVVLKGEQLSVSESITDSVGCAHFNVPAGIYEASISSVDEDEYFRTVYNGTLSNIVVGADCDTYVSLPVNVTTIQESNPLIIKEAYIGGCAKDDGSGIFACDKCIILYNNSARKLSVDNLGIGMCEPYNAEAGTHSFLLNGTLQYASENWLPCINGIWYFQGTVDVEPYSEVVVNVCGAVNNTLTYTNSVNYANADYYCMYDPEAASRDGSHYNNTRYYPTPSELIPSSHYLKAVKYGQGNAWPCSQTSPALVLFRTEDVLPYIFASNADNIIYPTGKQDNLVYACLSMPRSWILDGVEIYNAKSLSSCKKRLTSDIDNGYVQLTNGLGHSLVRKVDESATAKAGHTVYQDTNNSTNDFYESEKCSLR